MDFFDNRYYRTNRLFLTLIGQWPYQKQRVNLFSSIFIISVFASAIFVQVSKLITAEWNINCIAEICQSFISCMSFTANFCTHYFNVDSMRTLVDRIKADWDMLTRADELTIIEKYASESRLYTLALTTFFAIALCTLLLTTNMPILLDIINPLNESRAKETIFPAEYFVDGQKYFYPILVHMCVVVVVGITVSLALFTMFLSYVQHACGMFSVVGYQLEHAFELDAEVDTDILNRVHRQLIRGIEFHQRTLQFTDVMTSCYSPSYFIQLALLFALLTIDILRMFDAITLLSEVGEIVMSTVHVLAVLTVMFLASQIGQKLLDHSTDVFERAWRSSWFLASRRTQQLMVLVLMRSARVCSLAVTNSLQSSYRIFATAVQTSLSYFMVLYTLRQ